MWQWETPTYTVETWSVCNDAVLSPRCPQSHLSCARPVHRIDGKARQHVHYFTVGCSSVFLLEKPHIHETHVWAARPNRKGGCIGYSMTCVSRSSCIWSFKSFCLKDLVLRGGTVYDTLAGPLINWNQFFKGNHKSPFLFLSGRAMVMAPFKVGLSTFFHHYC